MELQCHCYSRHKIVKIPESRDLTGGICQIFEYKDNIVYVYIIFS